MIADKILEIINNKNESNVQKLQKNILKNFDTEIVEEELELFLDQNVSGKFIRKVLAANYWIPIELKRGAITNIQATECLLWIVAGKFIEDANPNEKIHPFEGIPGIFNKTADIIKQYTKNMSLGSDLP